MWYIWCVCEPLWPYVERISITARGIIRVHYMHSQFNLRCTQLCAAQRENRLLKSISNSIDWHNLQHPSDNRLCDPHLIFPELFWCTRIHISVHRRCELACSKPTRCRSWRCKVYVDLCQKCSTYKCLHWWKTVTVESERTHHSH